MNRIMSFAAALALVLASVAGRAEATEYNFTTIDQYVGSSNSAVYGFNDAGQIVGDYRGADGIWHGYVLSGNDFAPFDHPDTVTPWGTRANSINSQGHIVGAYMDSLGAIRAYLREGDIYTDIIPLAGSTQTAATGINDAGHVVGWYRDADNHDHGFYYDGSSYVTLDAPDVVDTYVYDINNAGVIVGSGWESGGYPHALIRDVDGTYTEFFVFGHPAEASGINDVGQIVGGYGVSPSEVYGYVLSDGIDSTPDTLAFPDAVQTVAFDISNTGQVGGWYTYSDYIAHAYLATPIAAADFDKDGDVDGADLALWQGDYGLNANCDADGDGDTDGRDFLVWQRQYTGATMPSLSVSVPEPASLWLALMALAGSALASRNTF